jgi:glycosyltransferase involved in cell wall biosynthesis
MRVLIVTPQFLPVLGGAERQAHALGRMLGERGHRVVVLTRRMTGLPLREAMDGVSVVRAIWAIEAGPLYGLTYTLSAARFLLRHRSQWDVVHITHIYLDAFAAMLTRRWHGLPIVVRPACAGHYGDLARLARLRAWPLYPGPGKVALRALIRTVVRADAFIANSRELREELVAAGCPAGKVAHIPNGVDLNRFHPDPAARSAEGRRCLGLPEGPLMVFAGRLDPQKGLHTLMDAMRSPALAVSGARVVLLGDGPQRAELAEAVQRHGLSDRVLFRGVVEEVAPYLRASDIFAFPTMGEGMPNALLEAMATGLPCVASAVGGCRDVITNGETGLLVPPGDAAAFQEALEALIQSSGTRERLGAAARQDAVSRFGLERMVERYETCYRTVVAGHPVASISGENLSERP